MAALSRPESRPPALRHADLARSFGTPADCREALRRLVDDQLAGLRALEEELRTGKDALERSRVVDPLLFIQDEVEARRFFRYFPESRSTFLRCFKELEATRQRDARADDEDCDDRRETAGSPAALVSPNEPGAATAAVISPNEPGAGDGRGRFPERTWRRDGRGGFPERTWRRDGRRDDARSQELHPAHCSWCFAS